jgi:hypothetical protein
LPKASDIFKDNKDRDNFLAKLGDILVETRTLCFAWALIPNHFHLIDAIVNPAIFFKIATNRFFARRNRMLLGRA